MRGRGNILKRGRQSWRIKIELPPSDTGERRRLQVTVRGNKAAAERELTRLLRELDTGVAVAPDHITVAQHLRAWLWNAPHGLAPKTIERYRQLAEQQIAPHLGAIGLQKLAPRHIKAWHSELVGTCISARTIGHAHRLLHKALEDARAVELVHRNVASVISPPSVQDRELEILGMDEIQKIYAGLADHWLRPIFAVALGSGAKRGELLALRWSDIADSEIRIERSLEQTKDGIRFKPPKSRHGQAIHPVAGVGYVRD